MPAPTGLLNSTLTRQSRFLQLLNHNARADSDELAADPLMKAYFNVWNQLVVEDLLLKHCNECAISIHIVVPAVLREKVFRALHEPAHHGYVTTLRRIAQRFYWPRVRSDVSAFVKRVRFAIMTATQIRRPLLHWAISPLTSLKECSLSTS